MTDPTEAIDRLLTGDSLVFQPLAELQELQEQGHAEVLSASYSPQKKDEEAHVGIEDPQSRDPQVVVRYPEHQDTYTTCYLLASGASVIVCVETSEGKEEKTDAPIAESRELTAFTWEENRWEPRSASEAIQEARLLLELA